MKKTLLLILILTATTFATDWHFNNWQHLNKLAELLRSTSGFTPLGNIGEDAFKTLNESEQFYNYF